MDTVIVIQRFPFLLYYTELPPLQPRSLNTLDIFFSPPFAGAATAGLPGLQFTLRGRLSAGQISFFLHIHHRAHRYPTRKAPVMPLTIPRFLSGRDAKYTAVGRCL